MIQRLGSDVISELRSGVTLSSLSACVEEMVLNAIDAGSNNIAIDVDISKVSLEVRDNGFGMCQSDLQNVGQRYFTSKCNSLKELQTTVSYGFRGEALASLGKVCQKVEIISRHKSSNSTFYKLFRKGTNMGVYESMNVRPMHGTTIKVSGVFYSHPVRQKLISEKVDLEQIRRHVMGLALINPDIAFLVRNQGNGDSIIFQTHACASALSVVSQILSWWESKVFKSVSFSHGLCAVNGYVNVENLSKRNFQFFYVNKRLVLKTRFHDVAHHMLARAITGQKRVDNETANQDQASDSPGKVDKNVGFVLNLECPHHSYDITFDPKKTLVEFHNWEEPIFCLKGCLSEFLMKEGIFDEKFFGSTFNSQEYLSLSQESSLLKNESKIRVEHPNFAKRPINPLKSHQQRSLQSATAKRKRKEIVASSTRALWSISCDLEYDSRGNTSERDKGTNLLSEHSLSFDECLTTRREPDISCHINSIVNAGNTPKTLSKRSIIAKLQADSVACRRKNYLSDSSLRSDEHLAVTSSKTAVTDNMPETSSRRTFITTLQGYSGPHTTNMSPISSKWTSSSSSNSNNQRLPEKIEKGFQELNPVDKFNVDMQFKEFHAIKTKERKEAVFVNQQISRKACSAKIDDSKTHGYSLDSTSNESQIVNASIAANTNVKLRPNDGKEAYPTVVPNSKAEANMDKKRNVLIKSTPVDTKNNLGSIQVMTSSNTATTSTNTNTFNEAPAKDTDWLLQHNPQDGQSVYINLRNGNTSAISPCFKLEPENTAPQKATVALTGWCNFRPFRNFASHLSHNFSPWLRRNTRFLGAEDKRTSEVSDMLDQWVNPVFCQNYKFATDVSFTESSKTGFNVRKSRQPFRFTKDCFTKMKVINQVDNKFIMCYLSGCEEGSFLVLVDQHAAHERVRLESFTKDLYLESQENFSNMVVKSSPLNPSCKLSMAERDIHLMKAFRGQLQQVGITFEDPSSDHTVKSVCVTTVPSLFLARESLDDGETLRSAIKNCIQDLIKEQIEVLLSTKGAAMTALPNTLTKLLNSRACHDNVMMVVTSAIRFGDALSTEECVDLMASLSTCDLPFQCAHGRPTMIPLINSTLTQSEMSRKATSLPRIARIKKHIKGKFV